jgi:hypothetical protein
MKLMKDMNRTELIELVATVSLRVLGFDFAVSTVRHLFHFSHFTSEFRNLTDHYTIKTFIMDISFDGLMAIVLFLLTVPLARLLCRGLSHALDLKPQE